LDIVQKIWASLGKLFALVVSQAGYGPDHAAFRLQLGQIVIQEAVCR